ncbi:hypothetical protein RO3G_04226 [Rhizopus delemar RA 99-880]|uniref:Uncharacterized protein n=1 Tax=Rhizopus delemar (strain RA 99-880 / ATCC MYA-4621 / FGSC 9543 / NRRL 43880) TaxID=246409 RepID=I1BTJ1_RHIO9|nr:hypothetical protein RO3G_04226 [Rhizopus delemar RA 99-880]|eukprot:EIE79521.1 hypothetical protein RO3G_04226 [Rhizopus delemar RA 99-880]
MGIKGDSRPKYVFVRWLDHELCSSDVGMKKQINCLILKLVEAGLLNPVHYRHFPNTILNGNIGNSSISPLDLSS